MPTGYEINVYKHDKGWRVKLNAGSSLQSAATLANLLPVLAVANKVF